MEAVVVMGAQSHVLHPGSVCAGLQHSLINASFSQGSAFESGSVIQKFVFSGTYHLQYLLFLLLLHRFFSFPHIGAKDSQ